MRLRWLVSLLVMLASCGRARTSVGDDGGVSLESTTTDETTSIASAANTESTEDTDEPVGDYPECPIEIELIPPYDPPNVMFVVDTSSSMLDGWDHDGDPMTPTVARWSTARALLEQLVVDLGPYPSRMGLQRAPSSAACAAATIDDPMCTDADVCLVDPTPEIEIGDSHGDEILAALPDASASPLEIVGGSPIRAAWLAARDHLIEQPEETVELIVLITDGGASCSEPTLPQAVETFDEQLLSTVAEGFEVYGIETIVVGVGVADQPTLPAQPDSPAVDTQAALNDLGMAGGHLEYFDAATPDELVAELASAGCGATGCTFDLTMFEKGPVHPLYIPSTIVEIDGETVPQVDDCALEDGWAWVTPGLVMSLCGSYCDDYSACAAVFDLLYGVCGH